MSLTPSQQAALDYVTDYARSRKDDACTVIGHVLRMSNIEPSAFEEVVERVKAKARVGLHFHPDRPGPGGKSVAEGLLDGGAYKSQFETQLSSGSVSAFPGGDRDKWEERLFGGAYQLPGATIAERPKYGALDLMHHPDGPSPRFGSCYLLLAPEVSARCTFTYLDSHADPEEKGTYEAFDDILAAVLIESFARDFAIGERGLTPSRLISHLGNGLGVPLTDLHLRPPARNLNHYVEAQVHGDVTLVDDVQALVADPSFRDTPTGEQLEALSVRYGVPLHWHGGFVLPVAEVPSDFRGPAMPSLAARIARDGIIDARTIGEAAVALDRDPGAWSDRGPHAQVLQELKLMWHCLVKFGHAADRTVAQ